MCKNDGIIEWKDENGLPLVIFTITSLLCCGLFTGAIIASSITVNTVKEKYCTRYTNTQEYLACTHKDIQEIYSLMEQH